MPDFTSSLYLGMKHGTGQLTAWEQLTTGLPSILYEPLQSKILSRQVAQMQGLETGITAPSTLHLYWDLFGLLSIQPIVVFIDDKIYPVSKYGIERLMVKHIHLHTFRHLDAAHLAQLVQAKTAKHTTPVVLTDGFCPQCGKAAPLKAYLEILQPFNGKIIVDDTQAFGILGRRNKAGYGTGGGGILQWLHIRSSNVTTITSLAKAFGAPLAVLCGTVAFTVAFKEKSQTSYNSSPVSMAHAHAGLHALDINRHKGDHLRYTLWQNVSLFRTVMRQQHMQLTPGMFPLQVIENISAKKAIDLHSKIKALSIQSILLAAHLTAKPCLAFIITSDHTTKDILSLTDAVRKNLRKHSSYTASF